MKLYGKLLSAFLLLAVAFSNNAQAQSHPKIADPDVKVIGGHKTSWTLWHIVVWGQAMEVNTSLKFGSHENCKREAIRIAGTNPDGAVKAWACVPTSQ